MAWAAGRTTLAALTARAQLSKTHHRMLGCRGLASNTGSAPPAARGRGAASPLQLRISRPAPDPGLTLSDSTMLCCRGLASNTGSAPPAARGEAAASRGLSGNTASAPPAARVDGASSPLQLRISRPGPPAAAAQLAATVTAQAADVPPPPPPPPDAGASCQPSDVALQLRISPPAFAAPAVHPVCPPAAQ